MTLLCARRGLVALVLLTGCAGWSSDPVRLPPSPGEALGVTGGAGDPVPGEGSGGGPAVFRPISPLELPGEEPAKSVRMKGPDSGENAAGEVRSAYRYREGDVLLVNVQEAPELSKEATIGGDGTLSLPLIGSVSLLGKTQPEAVALLEAKYGNFYDLIHVSVGLKTSNSGQVFFVGGKKPGSIPLQGNGTLLEMMTLCGWSPGQEEPRQVSVIRGDRVAQVSPSRILEQSWFTANLRLRDGDIVVIGEDKPSREIKVYVLGQVKSPGVYTQTAPVNVMQAMLLAGGASDFGTSLQEARLVRGYPSSPAVLAVNLERLLSQGDVTQNLLLEDGDVLYLPKTGSADIIDFLNRAMDPYLKFSSGSMQATEAAINVKQLHRNTESATR